MLCPRCRVGLQPGLVLAPVWGTTVMKVISDGTTIYPIGGAFTECLKCPQCGHSKGPRLLKEGSHIREIIP